MGGNEREGAASRETKKRIPREKITGDTKGKDREIISCWHALKPRSKLRFWTLVFPKPCI